jgi:dTDP-4-dehydrorhamnose reductase
MTLYNSVLITGANGMLGHALTDLLIARGHKPTALTRAALDISDDSALSRAFNQHRPTLVLNCAAHTKVDLCEHEREKADAINGYAVGKIASLCKSTNAALVHVSTDFVFDGTQRHPYRVTDPVNPLSAYGQSKRLGETELQKNAPERWLIARTAWVYGRHGDNFPRTMATAAQAGKPLTVVDDQRGSPTYAPDLAEAILALIDTGATGLWNITNSGETTWFDFAKATLEEFNIPAQIAAISSAEWTRRRPTAAIRPGFSVLDLAPLTKQLNRPMRPWREALKDYAQAVAANGF